MIERDKIEHFTVGALACTIVIASGLALRWSLIACVIAGPFAALFAGFLKELYDQLHAKRHTPDKLDALATFLGGLSIALVVSVIRLVGISLALFLLTCGLLGCAPAPRLPVAVYGPPAPASEPTTKADAKVENADAKVDRLTGELAAAKSEASSARRERDEARLAWLHRMILWLSGICILGVVGFTIAFLFTHVKTFAVAALSFAGGLIALQLTSFALAHMAWIIGGVIVASVFALIGVLLHNRTKTRAIVDSLSFGEAISQMAQNVGLDTAVTLAKQEAAKRQVLRGTKSTIENALDKASS